MGYSSYADRRRQEGVRRGLTSTQAFGHPSRREVGASAYSKLVADVRGASYVQSEVRDPGGPDPKLVIRTVDQEGKIVTHVYPIEVRDTLLGQLKRGKVPPPSPGSYGLDIPRTRPPIKKRSRRRTKRSRK